MSKEPLITLPRRAFVGSLAGSILGAMFADDLFTPGVAAAQTAPKAKAKACIVLWMNGGPSHIDTFDPKPGQKTGGPFKAIKTSAKGMSICEHLPRIAAKAHHLAVLRGLSTREGNHDRARHLLHTGYTPNPTVIHPSLGGWVSAELGGQGDLPAFVSLGGPSQGAGFLGAEHGPLVVKSPGEPPQNTTLPKGVNEARFTRRRAMLDAVEAPFEARTGERKVAGRRAIYARAMGMMRAPGMAAFDIASEPKASIEAYGDTHFGRGCLVARRLVEAGVRLVEVTLDGWDTHQDNFARTQKLMGALDPAMAALIDDLDKRKLLSSTLVVCMGEFGRSPKINENDGRDHHPACFSAALAGGGVRGGVVHGQTDAEGAKVASGSVAVGDLFTTLVTQLGMDPDKTLPTPSGRPISITENGQVLKEILT